MWKAVGFTFKLLQANEIAQQQLRTTYILERQYPLRLVKRGREPRKLKQRNYIYKLVKNTDFEKQPNLDVILRSYVEGLGNPGETVSVRPNYAYNKLLLPGLAVYASPENLKKYENLAETSKEVQYSSSFVLYTMKTLSRMTLSVIMNKENPWTLQPWHVKVSFRKCGYIVPAEAITLPEKPISGPNMDLESKEFVIGVTINNKEKIDVRCRIHHWSTNLTDRIPYVYMFWETSNGPVLEEQASILESLPKRPPMRKLHQTISQQQSIH